MKKLVKNKIYKHKIDVYNVELWFGYFTDYTELSKLTYNYDGSKVTIDMFKEDVGNSNCICMRVYTKDKKPLIILLFRQPLPSMRFIVHECYHAMRFIKEIKEFECHESCAYLLDYIFTLVYEHK